MTTFLRLTMLLILVQSMSLSLAADDTDSKLSESVSLATESTDPELTQTLLASIVTHLEQGDYDKAVEATSELVAQLPDNALLHNLLGLVYMAGDKDSAARQEFESILQLESVSLSAQLNLARLDIKAGHHTEAIVRYRWILERDPGHLDALLSLIELADQADNPNQALRWLEQAWEHNPDSMITGLMLLQRYLEQDDKLEALRVARELHLDDYKDPTGLRAFGLALLASGETVWALTYFHKLAALLPESPEVWHLIATTLLRTQDYQAATEALDKALKAQSDYLPSLMVRTQLYLLDKHYKKALSSAHIIQAQHPEHNVGFKLEGDVYMARENFAKAASAYRRAYDQSTSAQLALLLAHAQRLAGVDSDALTTLRDWLTEHPEDSHIRTQLAMYLDRMHKPAEAIAEYEHISQQEPDNAVILNNLAWLYHTQKDPRSIQYGERALALAPSKPEIADTLGWILVQNDQSLRGLELLKQAAAQAPQIPDIRYHLAVAYEKQGLTDEARTELERLLESDKVFADADKVKVLLKRLK